MDCHVEKLRWPKFPRLQWVVFEMLVYHVVKPVCTHTMVLAVSECCLIACWVNDIQSVTDVIAVEVCMIQYEIYLHEVLRQ